MIVLKKYSNPVQLEKQSGRVYIDTVRIGDIGSTLKLSQIIIADYTASTTDQLLRLNPSAGGFTITLPSAGLTPAGFILRFKNESNSTNPILLSPAGVDTIDGAASLTLNVSRGSLMLVSDGIGNWMVI
jgi:hypothetical protein